jgi:hypothetical protein
MMTNLTLSEAPVVESLMMDPFPRNGQGEETRAGMLARVRSRFSWGSR